MIVIKMSCKTRATGWFPRTCESSLNLINGNRNTLGALTNYYDVVIMYYKLFLNKLNRFKCCTQDNGMKSNVKLHRTSKDIISPTEFLLLRIFVVASLWRKVILSYFGCQYNLNQPERNDNSRNHCF